MSALVLSREPTPASLYIALTTDLPIERFWRQARSYRITEGASEVMKMVIARNILRTYG